MYYGWWSVPDPGGAWPFDEAIQRKDRNTSCLTAKQKWWASHLRCTAQPSRRSGFFSRKMERHHIHHAKGLLGEEAVISRMRHDCATVGWTSRVRLSTGSVSSSRFMASSCAKVMRMDTYRRASSRSSLSELRLVLATPNYAKQPLVRLLERLFPAVRT